MAKVEAIAYANHKLLPEHIVIAMLTHEKNEAYSLLEKLNVNIVSLYDRLSDYLGSLDISPLVGNQVEILPNNITSAVLSTVDKECIQLNDGMIYTQHILLSILNQKTLITDILMDDYGVNYYKLKNLIMDERKDINNSFDDFEKDGGFGKSKGPSGIKKGDTSESTVLDNFCRNISKIADEDKIDPIVGREKEIKRLSTILSRRKKNNPVLIGEPGVGKTSVVEGLAKLIKEKKAPRVLLDKKIYSLDLPSIVAGTKYRGQFEERMKAILEELVANPNIILFIDEIHTLVGAGNSSGAMDAANIFKPALASGEIQVMGATTLDEYRENIEKDGALVRRFQEVIVNEPNTTETKVILNNIKEKYEDFHNVTYSEEAIDECVKLADRYITDRANPDKTIDILDEAGAMTNIDIKVPQHIEELESELEDIISQKNEVVKKQKYEEAAKLRDSEKKCKENLDESKKDWMNSLKSDENKTLIDVELIKEVVSNMTGIPLNKVSDDENTKLVNMEKELTGKVIGQDDAVIKVSKAIKRNRLGIGRKEKPIGSFIFLGPTGVGKTHLAKLLAEQVFGDMDSLIRVDMSEYMQPFAVSRLIGAPPGYVGYEEGGKLTEAVRRKPYSVILFDEIEKAHPDVFNLMLQLFDEGHLTDSLGRKVDFKNTLIILTSNVGVKELNSFGKSVGFNLGDTVAQEEEKARNIIEKALKKKFKPEFLNRIDDTIIFNTLRIEDINEIINIEVDNVAKNVKTELNITLEIDDKASAYIAEQGYKPEFGARPLKRAIQRYVEDVLSENYVNGLLKNGDSVTLTYNKETNKVEIK